MSSKRHKIEWPQLGKTIEVEDGATVLDGAVEHELDLDHACGGFCACTTCHIEVVSGAEFISPMQEDEQDRLESKSGITDRSRLACQSKVHGNLVVRIPGR